MGLKWFRARLTMRGAPMSASSTPGFYRSMSQFDSDVSIPSIAPRQNRGEPSIHSVPTSPGPIAIKPAATLNNGRNAKSNSDEEPESPEEGVKIPRHLPRESIEIMRSGSAESSPSKMAARSKKADFKKRKARAPLPRTGSCNASDDNRKFVSVEKGRNTESGEMEI